MAALSDDDINKITSGGHAYYLAKTKDNFEFRVKAGKSPSEEKQDPTQVEEKNGQSITIGELSDGDPNESLLYPPYRKEYSLMFGSYHFFVLLKKIVTIYERLLKAKIEIYQQVQ